MSEQMVTAPATEDLFFEEERGVEEATAQFISFRLGDEWYGVRVEFVREVVRVQQIAYLPSAPAHIAGILNLRGNIVSITDPKRLFQIPTGARDERSRVIVIESAGMETGLLVDEVGEVASVPVSLLEPPLATLDAGSAAWVEYTCRWGGRLLAVLKTERFLDTTN